ncbi:MULTISPECIES: HNH endonuclease signature motif containing protein [unclassified Gordonia (in: high G+C Gram-positive bacteria)]|uniref:HNH endonuclease signature motif containing protein n=2 Tax=Gordonia TaxID=2053 RepID=UPI0010F4994A|nr:MULTISPECIES: HNH endonuclease signature motif containing protein [unclassified Gordonia (in: high G+C Gram-positive bacteria)]
MFDSQRDVGTDAPTPRAVELVADLHRTLDKLQTVDLSPCTDAELADVAAETERAIARLIVAGDRQIDQVEARDLPRKAGCRTLMQFMTHRLRVSNPMRRRKQMDATAHRTSLGGEVLPPEYPCLAEAFAQGAVGTAHVQATLDVLDRIPGTIDHDIKVAAERQMAEIAEAHTPAEITQLGARLLAHLDPDGTLTDDTDQKRRRGLWIGRQRADGTAKISGTVTPALVARLTMMFAVWGKPGLNNPDDPHSPSGPAGAADPDALAAAADRDGRTLAQTNHDALDAALAAGFADGTLGTSHRGLPVQLIIKADLSDLIREAGLATTATGTLLPIKDVITMAGDVQPWLAIFKDATTVPLYFGRGKRLATREQRLVSFARPDGEVCSAPGCDQPATHVDMHHAQKDWAKGGLTDIDDLAPACPRHNRMVGEAPGQYTTRVVRDGPDEGRCLWRLNAEPGAPPNPERLNRRPDIPRRFAEHLNTVRDEIHGPPTRPGGQTRPDGHTHADARRSWSTVSHVIDVRPPRPKPSVVDAFLTEFLARN